MQTVFTILAVSCLTVVTYQDFSSRTVDWFYFPLLTLFGFLHSFSESHDILLFLKSFSYNLMFVLLQLAILVGYFWIRDGERRPFFDERLGWGDVAFLVASATFFSTAGFLIFYVASLIFSILGVFVCRIFNADSRNSIPLAGLQATFLACTLLVLSVLHCSIAEFDFLIANFLSYD